MKILLITEFFPGKEKYFSGGVEVRTFFIAQNLATHHRITVLCRKKKGEKSNERYGNLIITRFGKETEDFDASFFSIIPRFIFMIWAFIKGLKVDFDLVEGSNFICLIPAYFIGFFKKKPQIAWYPDIYGFAWFNNFPPLTAFSGWLIEKIGLLLPWQKIIALSQQTKNKLIKAGIKAQKIKVIYGGVEVDYLKKISVKKFKNPTVCCIARLVSYKNVEDLIQAIKQIKEKIPLIKCFIIGKGPEEKKLKKLTSKLNLTENIIFRKDLNYLALIKYLKKSQVFCLPSKIEGFGLVTIEALACGTPFIISDIPINREITKNKGGLYYSLAKKGDLALKIISLLKNENKRKKILKGSSNIIKEYRWENISQQTLEAYKEAIYAKDRL